MYISIGNAQVSLNLEQLTGQPGIGLYQIRLDLRATAVPPSALRGTYAIVDGSMEFGSSNAYRYAGQLHAARPLIFLAAEDSNAESTISLLWAVTGEQLERMEALRNDREPYLRANLGLHLFRPGQPLPAPAWGTVNLPIGIPEWVRVLEQIGYAQALVLVIPMPVPDSSEAWSGAVSELRAARAAATEGRYRDAVATARHVLELLQQVRPIDLPTSTDKRERTKDQRFETIRRAIEDLTDAPHHSDETTRMFGWERHDAVAAVNLVASLMQWLAASALE